MVSVPCIWVAAVPQLVGPSPEVISDTTLVCTTPPGGESTCTGVPLEIALPGVPTATYRGAISTQNRVPLIQRASASILRVQPRSASPASPHLTFFSLVRTILDIVYLPSTAVLRTLYGTLLDMISAVFPAYPVARLLVYDPYVCSAHYSFAYCISALGFPSRSRFNTSLVVTLAGQGFASTPYVRCMFFTTAPPPSWMPPVHTPVTFITSQEVTCELPMLTRCARRIAFVRGKGTHWEQLGYLVASLDLAPELVDGNTFVFLALASILCCSLGLGTGQCRCRATWRSPSTAPCTAGPTRPLTSWARRQRWLFPLLPPQGRPTSQGGKSPWMTS